MATIKKAYLLATFFISGLAVILTLLALATENWIESNTYFTAQTANSQANPIQYGLFKGTYRRHFSSDTTYDIEVTCLFDENKCAMVCGNDAEERKQKLRNIINGGTSNYESCAKITRDLDKEVFNRPIPRVAAKEDQKFINAGVYISTILFLILSCIFGLLAAGLGLYNSVANPVFQYLSIKGLYIYNSGAAVCALVFISLWGAMFSITLFEDAAIEDTISGFADSNGRSNLGYSYWINLVSLFLYLGSVGVLYLRSYLISKDPVQAPIEEKAETNLYLF